MPDFPIRLTMAKGLLTPPVPDSMIISYMTLYKVVGLHGISLVPVLMLGSFILDDTKKMRNRVYRICGVVMLVSVVGISIANIPAINDHTKLLKPTLIFETLALVSFGFSWLTKGEFLLKDN